LAERIRGRVLRLRTLHPLPQLHGEGRDAFGCGLQAADHGVETRQAVDRGHEVFPGPLWGHGDDAPVPDTLQFFTRHVSRPARCYVGHYDAVFNDLAEKQESSSPQHAYGRQAQVPQPGPVADELPEFQPQSTATIQHLGDVEDAVSAVASDIIRRHGFAVKARQDCQRRDALFERVIVMRGPCPLRISYRHVWKLQARDTPAADSRAVAMPRAFFC